MEKQKEQPRRYDGPLQEVAEFMKSAKKDRDTLEKFLEKLNLIATETSSAEALWESLPKDIDELLRCGRMDEKTVEKLARKRAHLDLVPGRLESLENQRSAIEKSPEFGASVNAVRHACYEAGVLFSRIHLQEAIKVYVALGVEAKVAEEQANCRPDINLEHDFFSKYSDYIAAPSEKKLRRHIAAFDCFASGVSPASEDGAAIKKLLAEK